MEQPPLAGDRNLPAPHFYITGRQPFRPETILFAALAAFVALSSVLYAFTHDPHRRALAPGSQAGRSAGTSSSPASDDKDDPNQVDTIVLGDPANAPVPARVGDHVSPVHPTILVHLPRFGDQVGLIPDNPAGRALYRWLAAFNQASYPALAAVLPPTIAAAQLELRHDTGGFNLLSAKEVQPGVLVFRLRDQTPSGQEVLGSLQLRPKTNPPEIATFSLRAVPSAHQPANTAAAP